MPWVDDQACDHGCDCLPLPQYPKHKYDGPGCTVTDEWGSWKDETCSSKNDIVLCRAGESAAAACPCCGQDAALTLSSRSRAPVARSLGPAVKRHWTLPAVRSKIS